MHLPQGLWKNIHSHRLWIRYNQGLLYEDADTTGVFRNSQRRLVAEKAELPANQGWIYRMHTCRELWLRSHAEQYLSETSAVRDWTYRKYTSHRVISGTAIKYSS